MVLAGCAGKAQTLKVGATQFEANSLAAIDSIDKLMKAEIAAPSRNEAEASQEFVDLILGSQSEITDASIQIALDPDRVDLSPEVATKRTELLNSLRAQYTHFARVFDRIEEGSFFARDKISEAKEPAEKLTAQLAYFANSITDHPPEFTQRRSNLLLEIRVLHGDPVKDLFKDKKRRLLAPYGLPPDRVLTLEDKRRALVLWRERWLTLLREEKTLERNTVAQCLKASIIGVQIQKQIVEYNQLSLEDISEAMSLALSTAGALTGEDLSELQMKTNDVINTISNDEAWRAVVTEALNLVNEARATSLAP
jgi:hypothetical protein